MKSIPAVFVTLVLMAIVYRAEATTVSGNLTMMVNQGQYCDPATMNCTHARFPASQNGTCQPIREAVVHIVDSVGNTVSQTETDADGNYSVTLSTPQFSARIKWILSHADGRFRIGN